jgi:hypothetical protein
MAYSPDAQFSAEDKELLARAAAYKECQGLSDCSQVNLLKLSQARGHDFATAVLYDRVLREPRHVEFFQRVQSSLTSVANDSLLIGIVPGAFYREHKNTGADGARVAAILNAMGLRAECVPVESFGSLRCNAALISHWLANHARQRIALVSLSKGSADVKMALAQANASEIFEAVSTWISLSGLPCGTPLVAWLRRQPLRKLGVRLLLRLRGQRYSVVEELRHEADGPLAKWPKIPEHLHIVHVVAFPLRRHLAHPWAARAFDRVSTLGPNDGGGFLLSEVSRLSGIIFPVWGADHYLQPVWDVTLMLQRVFAEAIALRSEPLHANAAATAPTNPPASKSIA